MWPQKWINGLVDDWIDGLMDEWINGLGGGMVEWQDQQEKRRRRHSASGNARKKLPKLLSALALNYYPLSICDCPLGQIPFEMIETSVDFIQRDTIFPRQRGPTAA